MGSKKGIKNKEIEDILESDDELPSDYVDTAFVPAYKIDDRFETAAVDWMNIIKNEKPLQSKTNIAEKESLQCYDNKMLKRGILSKNDIFISKCVEMSDDTTLLWFVNFLIQKDLQSRYDFLRSCLVPSIQSGCYSANNESNMDRKGKRRYKIVVKM